MLQEVNTNIVENLVTFFTVYYWSLLGVEHASPELTQTWGEVSHGYLVHFVNTANRASLKKVIRYGA